MVKSPNKSNLFSNIVLFPTGEKVELTSEYKIRLSIIAMYDALQKIQKEIEELS